MSGKSINYQTGVITTSRSRNTRPKTQKAPKDMEEVGDRIRELGDDVTGINKQLHPDFLDFYSIATNSTAGSPAVVTLSHGFGTTSVRYCVYDVNSTSSTSPTYPGIYMVPYSATAGVVASDSNNLILNVVFQGTFTVRVEISP